MALGIQWEGKTFLDTRLLFGLTKIFMALAYALEWIVKQQRVRVPVSLPG